MEKVTLNRAVFQDLLENIPGMLYRCKFEPSWPILYVSKGSFDLTGYFPEELTQAKVDFNSIIHPEDRAWVWERFTEQLSKKEDCNCEYRIIAKDGKQKWVREIASGIFDETGNLLYIEGYIVDISEKKEHHKIISSLETHVNAINTSERRLRALLNAIPDTLFRINTITGNCFIYTPDYAIADFQNADLEGPLAGFFPPEIQTTFLENAGKAIKSAGIVTYEYQLQDENELKYFEARMVKSGDDEVIAIIRDVSHIVRAQNEKVRAWQFFQEVIDNANIEIAVFDKENRYKFVSKSGIKNEEIRKWIIDKNDFDYFKQRGKSIEPAEKRTRMFNLVKDLKRAVDWVEEIEDSSGSYRYYVRTLNPFKFYGEDFTIGYGTDITALKVVQNELQRREQLLTFSHEIGKIAYWVWSQNNTRVEWSDSIYTILEVERGSLDLSIETYLSFVHPEDRDRVGVNIVDAIKQNNLYSIEYRIITLEGKIKYLKEQSSNIEQSPLNDYFFGLVQDVTEFRLSQLALDKREEHFRAIAESSPVLILEVDRELRIKYINTLKVRKPEEVIGLTVFFFTHDDYKDLFRQKLDTCFKTGDKQQLQIVGQGAFSAEEWYDINIGPVKDKEGKIETLVLLAQNITNIKKSEKEMQRLIREVNHRYNELMQFNYVVSHNLRAPVANIMGMSYLLNNGLPEEETSEVLENLVKSADAIDALIKDLNDILAARSPLNEKKEPFFLIDILQAIQHDLASQIKLSAASITIELEVKEIISIKSYIQSILHHLISNSIKYKHHERTPEISVRSRIHEDSIFIEVTDNGIGIDLKQYKHQIFGLYKRFTNSVEGKGLGLHMVKSQVESLGGNIEVESNLNMGTTFKIRLNNI